MKMIDSSASIESSRRITYTKSLLNSRRFSWTSGRRFARWILPGEAVTRIILSDVRRGRRRSLIREPGKPVPGSFSSGRDLGDPAPSDSRSFLFPARLPALNYLLRFRREQPPSCAHVSLVSLLRLFLTAHTISSPGRRGDQPPSSL